MGIAGTSKQPPKGTIVKRAYKMAAGIAAALGLGLAATAATAHMGGGMGPGGHGYMHGPAKEGTGYGPMGGPGAQLMTPEERTAMMEKMRNAKTPEERQALMAANHAEMQKRAAEKGITLPEQAGPGAFGRGGMHRH
jgi:Spy/CpxP family protein refolding chaperone